MIRALIALGWLAALPASGQVGRVALYTDFAQKPSPGVVQALREEVELLLAPSALHFVWKSLPASGNEAWQELAVLKFSGRCEILPLETNGVPARNLGWTHISDGVILPFADIDCDAIRDFILISLTEFPSESREAVFGRAIGRVTAHELLHILSGTAAHSDHGVDHPSLTRSELVAARLDLLSREPAVHMVRPGAVPVSGAAARSGKAGEISYVRSGCANCHGANAQGTSHGPKLRTLGRIVDSIVLAAVLVKHQDKMFQRARSLKVAPPVLGEEELPNLLYYLNGLVP
jgi:cytochrome c553